MTETIGVRPVLCSHCGSDQYEKIAVMPDFGDSLVYWVVYKCGKCARTFSRRVVTTG